MDNQAAKQPGQGGLARYFVEHREVGWMLLVAALIWGAVSYGRLAQQEDPTIPHRTALLATRFPGATASQIEELVTQPLERKVREVETIEEVRSQSRLGVSVITVKLMPGSRARIEQEWDKLRAKLKEVALPEGCLAPVLDTDFGNTVTLLFAVASQPASEEECRVRASLVRSTLQSNRRATGAKGRAAVVAFYPPSVAHSYRERVRDRFLQSIEAGHLGSDLIPANREAFMMVDFATTNSLGALEGFVAQFTRSIAGTDGEIHPDFGHPIVLMGDEDPLPKVRAAAAPIYSYRELEDAAQRIEDELNQIASVGRVRKIGIVPESVHLMFSMPNVKGYGLTSSQVIEWIRARNALIPGGILRTEGHNFAVQLSGTFTNETELLDAVVGVSHDGLPVYLRDIFEVRRGYENPIPFNVDVLQRASQEAPLRRLRSVLLAVEMREGSIIADFNREVKATINGLRARMPEGMEVRVVSDQPGAVAARIGQFMKCFLEAVIIVIIVALFLMEWRSALVVATAIPLTVAMTLGGMHLLGVPLHQISIAALIIALGMLVDDPVVASDGINREMARGLARDHAAWFGPYRLRRAIFFGTVINIVAFLPLVLLPGDKGAFIVALPTVVTLALISSRIVSMTFIPLLGYHVLRGQKGLEAGGEIRTFVLFRPVDQLLAALLPRYRALLESALRRPWRAVAVAYGLLAVSLALALTLGSQFFPPAERSQFLIDIELPQTASVFQTRGVCAEVIEVLQADPGIQSAAVFMGGSAPRFYYNVTPKEPGNHLAQVLVNTRRADDVPAMMARLRGELDRRVAGARILVKQLEQGPAVDAPLQIRIAGNRLEDLRALADQVGDALRAAGGYRVHDDLGRMTPTLEINIDQARANTLNVDNAKIGRVMQAAFHGLKVTELREGDRLIPVVIRLGVDERNEVEKIRSLYVESVANRPLPLSAFADVRIKPEFASIPRFNQLRCVTVSGYSVVGELPSEVLKRARRQIESLKLPSGYRLEFAGEAKELQQSKTEMLNVMKVSLSLIAVAMVIQFGSVMKSLVVMLTIPLGLIGALVGMAVMRTSLGFMALLGIVSLAGVIVSHIIVLSDFIEEARSEGVDLRTALVQAGLVRLRAVLVTVLATVGGLIPLALTGGELWRPLTAVHIFGLLFATLLTLVLLPVLYLVFAEKFRLIK